MGESSFRLGKPAYRIGNSKKAVAEREIISIRKSDIPDFAKWKTLTEADHQYYFIKSGKSCYEYEAKRPERQKIKSERLKLWPKNKRYNAHGSCL